MEYILLYAAAALATSFSSIYEIIWPLIRTAKAKGVKNEFTEYTLLSLCIIFLGNTILAPFWLLVLLIPNFIIAANIGLSVVILQDSKNES